MGFTVDVRFSAARCVIIFVAIFWCRGSSISVCRTCTDINQSLKSQQLPPKLGYQSSHEYFHPGSTTKHDFTRLSVTFAQKKERFQIPLNSTLQTLNRTKCNHTNNLQGRTKRGLKEKITGIREKLHNDSYPHPDCLEGERYHKLLKKCLNETGMINGILDLASKTLDKVMNSTEVRPANAEEAFELLFAQIDKDYNNDAATTATIITDVTAITGSIISMQSAEKSKMKSGAPVISAAIGGLVLIICLALSVYLYVRKKRLNQSLSDEGVKEFLEGRSGDNESMETDKYTCRTNSMKFDGKYTLILSELQIDTETILGNGNFGTVYKGTVKEKPAAIKQPNKDRSKSCLKSILCEIKILCYTGAHHNIVGFLGAYMKEVNKGILYIATEFCSNGSLETFLRKKKYVVSSKHSQFNQYVAECTIFLEDLYRFCFEIACGMEHLEKKQVVHGDLSARNVFLDENYTCKIGDFGLSRKLYHYKKYVKTTHEPLPWKWMAFESLTKMEFTSKSDVWSYGVTIWEVFTLGTIPYTTFNMTMEFSNEIKNGLRLTKPEFASQKIYHKMKDCWNLDAEQRPTFAEVVNFFKEMQNNECAVLEHELEENYDTQM